MDEPERLMVRRLDASFQASWEYPGYPASNPAGRMNAIALDPEGRAAVGDSIVVGEQRDVRVMSVKPSGWPAWFPAYDYAGADGADDHIYGVATDRFGYVYYTGAETVGGVSRLMFGKLHP